MIEYYKQQIDESIKLISLLLKSAAKEEKKLIYDKGEKIRRTS